MHSQNQRSEMLSKSVGELSSVESCVGGPDSAESCCTDSLTKDKFSAAGYILDIGPSGKITQVTIEV